MSAVGGIIGAIVLLIGIVILFTIIGIGMMFIGPLILLLIGFVLVKKRVRILGLIFIVLGALALFNIIFHINLGEIILAVILVYIGIHLLKRNQKSYQNTKDKGYYSRTIDSDDKNWSASFREEPKEAKAREEGEPEQRRSFIGDLHLMHDQFELKNMNIWHGIGDVKIDLSKAMISKGETVVFINGWIGDIDIYVPYDMDISVNASVTYGELEVLNRRQSGFGRQLTVATKDYPESSRKVKIIISLLIGDIDVRFL
ncbi:MAG: cell wall-active antibiotics response protein LiaF [Tuberibacillus sp.]